MAISFRSVRDAIKLMRSDTHVNEESKVFSLIRAISFVKAIAVQMVRSCTILGLRTMSGVKSTSSALSEVITWESAIILMGKKDEDSKRGSLLCWEIIRTWSFPDSTREKAELISYLLAGRGTFNLEKCCLELWPIRRRTVAKSDNVPSERSICHVVPSFPRRPTANHTLGGQFTGYTCRMCYWLRLICPYCVAER